jgi:tetratricopeptide (TPR) repeat protein
MNCPVCRAVYRPSGERGRVGEGESESKCRRCGADLSPLIQIHDQALWYYRRALRLLTDGNIAEAKATNEQALALHHGNADFHALAGRLWALEGELQQAIVSWRRALILEAQHPLASRCLQSLLGGNGGEGERGGGGDGEM